MTDTQTALTVHPIPAFDDNYIWCMHDDVSAVVVDPGDADAVTAYLTQRGLQLEAVLITHHHWDHTGGLPQLLANHPDLVIYGPQNPNINDITHRLTEGDTIMLAPFGLTLSVILVPGHTLDHIAYVGDFGVFCGDTLFSGGCGRLFEGTPGQMWQSLQKLMALDKDLPVYCTHEYTLANLAFANAVEPENDVLKRYTQWANEQRQRGLPTLPSHIGQEMAINPFLRVKEPRIIKNVESHASRTLAAEEDVFAALRSWKDHF